jgi:hypothetical protein
MKVAPLTPEDEPRVKSIVKVRDVVIMVRRVPLSPEPEQGPKRREQRA